ncbi:MAG: ABC transporter permease, partial [Bacteroidota bacterium]
KPTGTVLDRLVLVTNQAYWAMHSEHDHEEHGEHSEHGEHGDHQDHGNHEEHSDYGESENLAASEGPVSVQREGEAPEVLRGVEREGAPRRSRRDHAHEAHPTSGSPNQDHHDHDHDAHDHGHHDHDAHDHHDEGHDHDHHDHDAHDHHAHDDHDHQHGQVQTAAGLLEEDLSQELTSVLIRYKNDKDFQSLQMGRMINENTDIMAVDPAYQISKVRYQFGQGERVLRILAIVIMIVSALSVFISLFNSLRERRYELALMRGMGAGRNSIFGLIIAEGLLLGFLGFVVGIALGHGLMEVLSTRLEDNYGFRFAGFQWLAQEWWLLLGALGVGLVAAILPAAQAAETDIADTLT